MRELVEPRAFVDRQRRLSRERAYLFRVRGISEGPYISKSRPFDWRADKQTGASSSATVYHVMKTFLGIVKQVLVAVFYKEAQLGRSLGKNNRVFKGDVSQVIAKLVQKADKGTLKNRHIRNSIQKVSESSHVSVGQAQKVINVYLKYYCILSGKPSSIIKQLDCPLDGRIISKYRTKTLGKVTLRDMKEFDIYVAWQDHLEVVGRGVRLRPDIETYDRARLKSFLT